MYRLLFSILVLVSITPPSFGNTEPVQSIPNQRIIKMASDLRRNPTVNYKDEDIEILSKYRCSEFFDLMYILLEAQLEEYNLRPQQNQKVRIKKLISYLQGMGRPRAIFLSPDSNTMKFVDVNLRFESLLNKYQDSNLDRDLYLDIEKAKRIIAQKEEQSKVLQPIVIQVPNFYYPLPIEYQLPVLVFEKGEIPEEIRHLVKGAPLYSVQKLQSLGFKKEAITKFSNLMFFELNSFKSDSKELFELELALKGTFNYSRSKLISLGFTPKAAENILEALYFEAKRKSLKKNQCNNLFFSN